MYVYIRSEGKCDGKKATNMIVLSRREYYIKGGGKGFDCKFVGGWR